MGLNLALGVGCLGDAVGEGDVRAVELIPHLVGGYHQQVLDLIPQLGRGRPLALGAQDVVVCKLGPGIRHRDAAGGKGRPPVAPCCWSCPWAGTRLG